jgi:hypothetical protein
LALLPHPRETPAIAAARLVGLVDPDLPPLDPALVTLVDAQRNFAYTGALDRPAMLVTHSPMLHDPLFTARLLEHPGGAGGHCPDELVYRDWQLAADLGLQLRTVSFGAIPGALSDCIGTGLPTVANAALADVLDAAAYIQRVPDALDPEAIAASLALMLDKELHRERPEAARAAYAGARNFDVYSARRCGALGLDPSG